MSSRSELIELKQRIGLAEEVRIESLFWRLNNLYEVVNEDGKKVPFKLRPVQAAFLKSLWWRVVTLKSRQHGFSTVIDVWSTDMAMFTPNINVGIIADSLDNAMELFRTKVLTPYQSMPEQLRAALPVVSITKTAIEFANGSKIQVGTRFRSGTLSILHVSEFGRIAAARPDLAKEIITGSFEAVHQRGYIIVESTAKGRQGEFYDMVQDALAQHLAGRPLSPLDFKLMFYAWFDKPENRLDFDEPIPDALHEYFQDLEYEYDIRLDQQQKAFYASKWKRLGTDMWQEHPSTTDECFKVSVEGAYLKEELMLAESQGRIGDFPFDPAYQVITSWDLGLRDHTAIWFIQRVGMHWHLIDFYENNNVGLDHYITILEDYRKDKGYRYAVDLIPHDGEVREFTTGLKRISVMESKGMRPDKVDRPAKKRDAIGALRDMFPMLRFNKETTDEGLIHLENYRKEWDMRLGAWKDTPLHDVHSNCADALLTLAGGIDKARTALTQGTARQDPRSEAVSSAPLDTHEALIQQANDPLQRVGRPRRPRQQLRRNRAYT